MIYEERLKLVIFKDQGVRPIPGSFLFAKLMMMLSTPAGDARYASQDPRFIQSTLSHTISNPICNRSAFFLRRTQQRLIWWPRLNVLSFLGNLNLMFLSYKIYVDVTNSYQRAICSVMLVIYYMGSVSFVLAGDQIYYSPLIFYCVKTGGGFDCNRGERGCNN